MAKLDKWENIIKEKRMHTPFRDFVKEITSWTVLNLYKHKWKICRYPDSWRVKNLDTKESQNASNYFLDYDFSKWFFENFKDLFEKTPLQYMLDFWNNENSDFADAAFWVKNAYLTFVAWFWIENVAYSAFCYLNSSNIYNSFLIQANCNNIYFWAWIINSFNVFYSKYVNDSSNIWFSTNLIWCQECIFCNWLQNGKYFFQNKQYEKEEYLEIKKQLLGKKEEFLNNYKFISKNEPINYLSENVNWKYNIKCHNVENWYWINNTSNSRNVIITWWDGIYNFYDSFDAWLNSSDFYWVNWAWSGAKNIYLSTQIDQSSNIYYSYFLKNCSFCIWCIWLKNKSYCIFNKQYSKEEWYELADKIFAQMDSDWILWEFFPWSLNPFYFNDTMAYLIDDTFTKEEVEKEGYLWRNEEIKVDLSEWVEVVNVKDLDIVNFDESILKKVIVDNNWNYYKIIKMEYDFLKKHNLPLPEIHWLDRIKLWFKF